MQKIEHIYPTNAIATMIPPILVIYVKSLLETPISIILAIIKGRDRSQNASPILKSEANIDLGIKGLKILNIIPPTYLCIFSIYNFTIKNERKKYFYNQNFCV